jgi:hypothetical protein
VGKVVVLNRTKTCLKSDAASAYPDNPVNELWKGDIGLSDQPAGSRR